MRALQYRFGCGYRSNTTGIIYNDEMENFDNPGDPVIAGFHPNANNFPEPGKRPLSSISPTVVTDDQGRARLILGSSGGMKIIAAVSQVGEPSRRTCCDSPCGNQKGLGVELLSTGKISGIIIRELLIVLNYSISLSRENGWNCHVYCRPRSPWISCGLGEAWHNLSMTRDCTAPSSRVLMSLPAVTRSFRCLRMSWKSW